MHTDESSGPRLALAKRDGELTVLCRCKSAGQHSYGLVRVRAGELLFRSLRRAGAGSQLRICSGDVESLELLGQRSVAATLHSSGQQHLFVFAAADAAAAACRLLHVPLRRCAEADDAEQQQQQQHVQRARRLQRSGRNDVAKTMEPRHRRQHWFDRLADEIYPDELAYERTEHAAAAAAAADDDVAPALPAVLSPPPSHGDAPPAIAPVARLFQLSVVSVRLHTSEAVRKCSLALLEGGVLLRSVEHDQPRFFSDCAVWQFDPPEPLTVLWRSAAVQLRIDVRIGRQPLSFAVPLPSPDDWCRGVCADQWRCSAPYDLSLDVVYGPYPGSDKKTTDQDSDHDDNDSGEQPRRRNLLRVQPQLTWLDVSWASNRDMQDALQKLSQPQTDSRLKDRNNQLIKVLKGAFCRRVMAVVPRWTDAASRAAAAAPPPPHTHPCRDVCCPNTASAEAPGGLCPSCTAFVRGFADLVAHAQAPVFFDTPPPPRFSNREIRAAAGCARTHIDPALVDDIHRLRQLDRDAAARLHAANEACSAPYRAVEFALDQPAGGDQLERSLTAVAARRRRSPWPVPSSALLSLRTFHVWCLFIFAIMTVKHFFRAFSFAVELVNAVIVAITE